jgi:hypothetical protein
MKCDEDKIMEKLLDGKQETYPSTALSPIFLHTHKRVQQRIFLTFLKDPFVIVKNVIERIGSTPLFNNFITMLNLLAKFAVDVDMDNEASYVNA